MFFTRSQIFSDVSRCSQDALECSKMFYRRSQDVLTEIPKIFNDVFICSQIFWDVLKVISDMSKMFSGCSQNVVGLMVDCLSRLDAEIVNKWIPSVGWITELMDSLSSSDDRIGGCPQVNRSDVSWFLFGQFWTLWPDFWPTLRIFGENCLLKLVLVWGQ